MSQIYSTPQMNNSIKLEELALLILGIYLFAQLDFAWWWFPLLLFIPDISMLGYAIDNRIGAWTYNLFHHRGTAIVVCIMGWHLQQDLLTLIGVILFSHIAVDRLFGYGLKYENGFHHTHLGRIGR